MHDRSCFDVMLIFLLLPWPPAAVMLSLFISLSNTLLCLILDLIDDLEAQRLLFLLLVQFISGRAQDFATVLTCRLFRCWIVLWLYLLILLQLVASSSSTIEYRSVSTSPSTSLMWGQSVCFKKMTGSFWAVKGPSAYRSILLLPL